MRYLITGLLLLYNVVAVAQTSPITPADSPIVVYRTSADFADVKSDLELAITGRGMLISNTLHISEMQERTAADTGLTDKLYEEAVSLEFCSILMSHRMSSAHPANMAICPLTISLFSKPGEPETIYLAYRRPEMLGDAETVERELTELYEGIILEVLE